MRFPFTSPRPPTIDEDNLSPSEEPTIVNPYTPTSPNAADIQPLVLSIEAIKPYDRNPRRERNPRYDEIKESIRAQGSLNTPLTVTHRPGEDQYMVESGGNTRLQVLRELFEETGDTRFSQVHCLFRPWVGESHVLSAHLIENELRGEMVLIDKALALQGLKALLEEETGETLSRNGFIRRLKQLGYAISKRQLIRYAYAAENLYPWIPEALRSGLGAKEVDRIRQLELAYHHCREACGQHCDESILEAVFHEALAANDSADLSLELVRQMVETRLCSIIDVPISRVRLAVDSVLKDPSEDVTQLMSPITDDNAAQAEAATERSLPVTLSVIENAGSAEKPVPGNSTSHVRDDFSQDLSDHAPSAAGNLPSTDHQTSTLLPPAAQPRLPNLEEGSAPPSISDEQAPTDVPTLRRLIQEIASGLAKRHQLADCLLPSPDVGMGYLLDLPESPLHQDDASALFRQWIWWLLLSFSEETVQPERLARIDTEHRLRDLILSNRTDEIFAQVTEPDWRALGFQLLSDPALDDRDFDDLLQLAVHCRRLRKLTHDAGDLTLWTGPIP